MRLNGRETQSTVFNLIPRKRQVWPSRYPSEQGLLWPLSNRVYIVVFLNSTLLKGQSFEGSRFRINTNYPTNEDRLLLFFFLSGHSSTTPSSRWKNQRVCVSSSCCAFKNRDGISTVLSRRLIVRQTRKMKSDWNCRCETLPAGLLFLPEKDSTPWTKIPAKGDSKRQIKNFTVAKIHILSAPYFFAEHLDPRPYNSVTFNTYTDASSDKNSPPFRWKFAARIVPFFAVPFSQRVRSNKSRNTCQYLGLACIIKAI